MSVIGGSCFQINSKTSLRNFSPSPNPLLATAELSSPCFTALSPCPGGEPDQGCSELKITLLSFSFFFFSFCFIFNPEQLLVLARSGEKMLNPTTPPG